MPSSYMNKSMLFYDSKRIYGDFAPNGVALCMLRNEQTARKLDQMIIDRQNRYLNKYFNIDQVVTEYKNTYGYVPGSQYYQPLAGFAALSGAITQRVNLLAGAYKAHPPGDPNGVVMSVQSTTTPSGTFVTTTQSEPLGGRNWPSLTNPQRTNYNYNKITGDNVLMTTDTSPGDQVTMSTPSKYDTAAKQWVDIDSPYITSTVRSYYNTNAFVGDFEQKVTSTNGQYFVPAIDNNIRYHEKMLRVENDSLNARLFASRVANLDTILANELKLVDAEVAKCQMAYISTFLVSPIAGVVTAVFKEFGECVVAGEPVLRVEDDTELLLTGRIQFRGILTIGLPATLHVIDLGESGVNVDVTGMTLVSIRGHDSEDDEWEVIFRVTNPLDKAGKKTFPLNYSFDKVRTTVTFDSL